MFYINGTNSLDYLHKYIALLHKYYYLNFMFWSIKNARSTEKPCCKSNWIYWYDDWLFISQCTSAKRTFSRWFIKDFLMPIFFCFVLYLFILYFVCFPLSLNSINNWNRWGGEYGGLPGITFGFCHHWCGYIRWQRFECNGCRCGQSDICRTWHSKGQALEVKTLGRLIWCRTSKS